MNFFEPSLNVPYQALFRKIQLKKGTVVAKDI